MVGLFSFGSTILLEVNDADTVDDLEGQSGFLGASGGELGVDLITNSSLSDPEGEINGARVTFPIYGGGADIHYGHSKTDSIKKTTWSKIWDTITSFFT